MPAANAPSTLIFPNGAIPAGSGGAGPGAAVDGVAGLQ
jgi:hypothetical protein